MATLAPVTEVRRHSLLRRLAKSRVLTDRLFEIVRPEARYERPIPERHRIIFYIGHLEAFDQNLLVPVLGSGSIHPEFDRLFAFGIDPVDGGLPADQPSDWPHLEEVRGYVNRVRERLDERLAEPGILEEAGSSAMLHVALEHRLMHAETLAYMFHQLPFDQKIAQWEPDPPPSRTVSARMIDIPAGIATLGQPRLEPGSESLDGFGWDNEFETLALNQPAFSIDAYNVTNGQFLEFMRSGGYSEKSLWSDEDWNWIQSHDVRHPRFWVADGDSWLYRSMFQDRPLPLDWPVYVSHAEASAYARWAGKALPTELQFHRAAYGASAGGHSNGAGSHSNGAGGHSNGQSSNGHGSEGERHYPWGEHAPAEQYGNFDFHRWDPVPVGSNPAGGSAFGVEDLVGNGWEWTATPFEPLPGFEPFSFYPGYSANFFDGKHYVMKGGSPRTAACMLRRSFRNWFQPHYPFVYAAFRCVRN